ncbi:MAG: hypothetical protein LKG25_06180 [Prevotella sp.]|jgi:hypothetical protein|nr:hypothetical protein [Prevotella sp.]MCI1282167.1 hypothetical protein [Prevotella sp.]
MAIVQVTSRDFRSRQKDLFDLADKGEKIIIRRGKKKAYTLTPVEDEDLFFTPKMLKKIDKSLQEAKDGKIKTFSSKEEVNKYLENL